MIILLINTEEKEKKMIGKILRGVLVIGRFSKTRERKKVAPKG